MVPWRQFLMVVLTLRSAAADIGWRARSTTPCTSYIQMKAQARAPRVVVIGGGAAGYFGAIEAARGLQGSGAEVIILEGTRTVLHKVKISGGGRCNVMHDHTKGVKEIAQGYPRGHRELLGPFNSAFGPAETYKWFSSEGVNLKVEADGRVFPTTDQSDTIIGCLSRAAERVGVRVRTGVKARRFSTSSDGRWMVEVAGSGSDSEPSTIECDRVMLATGSSRDGHELARSVGHTIVDPVPSLFTLETKCDARITGLAGISVSNAEIKVLGPAPTTTPCRPSTPPPAAKAAAPPAAGGTKAAAGTTTTAITPYTATSTSTSSRALKDLLKATGLRSTPTQTGPLLITHTGFSGPAVLKMSAFGARLLNALRYKALVSINWVPSLSAEDVVEGLSRAKTWHPKKAVGTFCPLFSGPLSSDALRLDDADSGDWWEKEGERSGSTSGSSNRRGSGEREKGGLVENESGGAGERIPRRLWAQIVGAAGIGEKVSWAALSKKQLDALAKELRAAEYVTTGKGTFKEEFVTCGGVSLKEVDLKTMESKLAPGLHFAGEVLDIDGITGGYNFQACWTTGWSAGHAIAEKQLVDS